MLDQFPNWGCGPSQYSGVVFNFFGRFSAAPVACAWYITAGHQSAEAAALRERLGDWDSEWSLRHMIQVLRQAILDATINPNSANEDELREMTKTLKNWANLAA